MGKEYWPFPREYWTVWREQGREEEEEQEEE
jgi:hypothetical protein